MVVAIFIVFNLQCNNIMCKYCNNYDLMSKILLFNNVVIQLMKGGKKYNYNYYF